MSKNKLEIVSLPIGNLQDIPGMLRRIANNMESGESVTPRVLIMVADGPDGDLDVYGLGDFSDITNTVGLLARAQLNIALG